MTPEEFKIEIIPWSVKLYPMANRILKNDSEAQDAIQEIMIKLWDKRNKLSHLDNPGAYIYTLCRNHCLDVLKKKRPSVIEDENDQKLINLPQQPTNYETSEKLEIVHRIIESLPKKYREVIQLREIDGLDFDEIKDITGFEIPHIRVILSRARLKIKEELSKVYDYEAKRYQSVTR
jgi:RNA polymerase sigma-70 factor (ECF subfamily)